MFVLNLLTHSLSPSPLPPPLASWKTNKMGDLSTAGTTASIIIFRQNHIFVANVGDSTTILGEVNPKAGEPGQHAVRPRVLTKDHKPDDPAETRRVERRGKPSLCVCVCVCAWKHCMINVYVLARVLYYILLVLAIASRDKLPATRGGYR